ncbi:hypothetical protein NDU88_011119 [Pleurodeles waltl]|uniref:Uncharacterized protein n=1 Tax=Pleurodeles waltl TaxID=8319 RepID=A0AAV7S0W4_PLEWA|nr:hypothetical protein NDU88_011119 [Pleurodeles waltl]
MLVVTPHISTAALILLLLVSRLCGSWWKTRKGFHTVNTSCSPHNPRWVSLVGLAFLLKARALELSGKELKLTGEVGMSMWEDGGKLDSGKRYKMPSHMCPSVIVSWEAAALDVFNDCIARPRRRTMGLTLQASSLYITGPVDMFEKFLARVVCNELVSQALPGQRACCPPAGGDPWQLKAVRGAAEEADVQRVLGSAPPRVSCVVSHAYIISGRVELQHLRSC